MNRIGDLMRKHREELGLSQEQYANRIGLSSGTVRNIETGNARASNPSAKTKRVIERALCWSYGSFDVFASRTEPTPVMRGRSEINHDALCPSVNCIDSSCDDCCRCDLIVKVRDAERYRMIAAVGRLADEGHWHLGIGPVITAIKAEQR